MNILRKSIIVLIVLCLTTALAAGSAMAAPKWMENGKTKGLEKEKGQGQVKLQAKVKFNDITGHWAEQNIVLINSDDVIKGYNDGSYKPNKPVNKEEALTMIARMAYGNITASPVKLKNTKISFWAGPSLDLAVKKGIISKVELDTLAFNKPAQRYEVAVWLVRALGLEDEAIDNAGADLDFKDESAIPVWARGYIKVATDEGIISGFPGNVFRPGTPVTRAEIATMLVRAREGFEMPSPRQGFSFIHGVITGIDGDSVTVKSLGGSRKVGTKELTVPVNDEALIYLEGKRADLEDLDKDDMVTMLLDGSGEAVVILARNNGGTVTDEDDNDIEDGTVEGIVESIGSKSITVKVNNVLKVYTLDGDVDVELDGKNADPEDIKKGYDVELTLEDNKVTKIEAESNTEDVSGTVESVGTDSITVKVNDVIKVYTLDGDVDVELDGKNAKTEDLEKGYAIEMTVEDGKVTEIVAYTGTISGILESVTTSSITVKVGNSYRAYDLSDDVEVVVNDKDAGLDDLKKGADVRLTLDDDEVVKIVAWVIGVEIN